ncbi:MAG TPA: Na/Pi symporter, partial [Spirochaetia bacterium]|nr:Na/Pi symporter [Spirochaetia bacterium]
LQNFANKGWIAIIVCVLVGTVFTMAINASSATIAITIGLATKGIIDFPMAAAITLGANIGTTFDSFLVSLGGNTNAKRAALAHILFNVFGTLWVIILFKPFLKLVEFVTPGQLNEATIGAHIAMLHTLFNTVNTLILFPFVKQYADFIHRLVKEKPGEVEIRRRLSYVAGPIMASPELNLVYARREITRMSEVARDMFSRFRKALVERPADIDAEVNWFKENEEYADRIQEELSCFLLEVTRQDVNEKTQNNIQSLLRIVVELENITDSCMNLIYLVERCERKKIVLKPEELQTLAPYLHIADKFLLFVKDNINGPISEEELALATELEMRLDELRNELRKSARKRLKAGAEVKAELLFIDMVRHIEKVGDYAFAISESLRAMM